MSLRWTDWLRAPLWPVEIFSARKQFGGNPLLGSTRLNRKGLHVFRVKLAQRMAAKRRSRLGHLISEEDQLAFHQDGFVNVSDFLTPAAFNTLKAEIMSLRGDALDMIEGSTLTRKIALSPKLLHNHPALRAFVSHHRFQGLARYISSYDAPPHVFVEAIHTHINNANTDPQTRLHIDTFHPSMKAWFFIEDISEEDGPLSYVKGSHALNRRRLAWHKRQSILKTSQPGPKGGALRLTAQDLQRLHLPPATRFTVPANTLIVGDTFGVHARTPTQRQTVRIEIWAYSRRTPFWPFTKPPLHIVPGMAWIEAHVLPAGLALLRAIPGLKANRQVKSNVGLLLNDN